MICLMPAVQYIMYCHGILKGGLSYNADTLNLDTMTYLCLSSENACMNNEEYPTPREPNTPVYPWWYDVNYLGMTKLNQFKAF